jgi:drug/metabolite transporter (DMT)-like permease
VGRLRTGRPIPTPYLLLVVATLCWAGNFVVGRVVHADIPPIALAFWRWAVAGAALLPFAAGPLWDCRSVALKHWRLLVVLAATGVVLFHVLVYASLRSTTATNAALIMATLPVIVPVISLLLDGVGVTRRQALGIVTSLIGVAVIIVRGDPAVLAGFRLAPGDLLMLLAVPMWALYTVLLRRLPATLPPLAMLLAITVIGLVLLLPAYVWEFLAVGGIALQPANVVSIAYVGLFASVISYICWNRAVGQVGANKAGQFIHLMPVFSTLLAILFLGEVLQPFHFAGIALIGAGIYLTTSARRPKADPKKSVIRSR